MNKMQILGWPKVSFRFFYRILWGKKFNEILGQSNISTTFLLMKDSKT